MARVEGTYRSTTRKGPGPTQSPTGVDRRPKRITKNDNASTIPNRVTFPVGTYYSNPSGALYGAMGTAGGTLPTPPGAPTTERLIYGQTPTVPGVNGPPVGYGGNFPTTPPRLTSPVPGVNAPPVGYGGNFPTTAPQVKSNPGNPPRPKSYQEALLEGIEFTNKLPTNLSSADLSYLANQGLNVAELAQFFTYDPKTGRHVLNQQGQAVNAAAVTGPLKPGQYVDTSTGEIKQGTTPFGTNAAGQRLDAKGNVWDPKTAKTDIYGGRFIQVGEVRWERNKNGRLVRVRYGKGGKKEIIQGGGRGGGRGKKDNAPAPSPSAPAPAPSTVSYQTTANFNVATG